MINKNENRLSFPFKIVTLKKTWVFITIIFLFIIITLILTNLYRYNKKEHRTFIMADKIVTTQPTDIHWYQQQQVASLPIKMIKPIIPQSVKPVNQFSADDLTAMATPIREHQLTSERSVMKSAVNAMMPSHDKNGPYEKYAFIKLNAESDVKNNTLISSVQGLKSPFELQSGSIIPGILLSGINSDLPGQIIAQVRSNVYDSPSGNYVLIPQGSRLTGIYDAQIAYGQQRILIIWQRIIFPNGQSIDLHGMPGVDSVGYAGFKGEINNHYWKLFGSTLLMSVIGVGGMVLAPPNNNPLAQLTAKEVLAENLDTNLANASSRIAEKNLSIQPTLTIPPGYEFNIFVTRDMVFEKPYHA